MSRLPIKRIILCLFIIIFYKIDAQQKSLKKFQTAVIMFYNVENFYDTIKSADIIDGNLFPNDPGYQVSVSEDSALSSGLNLPKSELTFQKLKGKQVIRKQILTHEFLPQGTKLWNSEKYKEKIKNISRVISETGKSETQTSPAIAGLCEIENEHVLQDLCNELATQGLSYGFIHFNSFDARGVDTALLYDKTQFSVINSERLVIVLTNNSGHREYTRDILLVEGLLDGEKMYFFVNHWPSRRGGEQVSLPKRMKAAEVMKKAMDSIQQKDPEAKILAMGDFNDDPVSPSIKNVFNTVYKKSEVQNSTFFNPAEQLFRKGAGTLAYQDLFNFFDQQIMSPSLILNKNEGYQFYRMRVFSPSYLTTQEGPWKGYPFRTFSGDNYTGGYSDHYPVYTILIKEVR